MNGSVASPFFSTHGVAGDNANWTVGMCMKLQSDVTDILEKDPGVPPDAVIVLGMHRAGTSTLTRGLQALGVDLGDDLVEADEDNPKGYWEDSAVHELNKKVLDALDLRWHSVGPIKTRAWENPALAELRTDAAALIRERFSKYALWGVKDPRLCRLLDFWQPIFQSVGIAESYVIVIRNPLSVAKSLWARNGFSAEKSHLLWLQHFLPALGRTHGKPRVVVDFDKLMENPAFQLGRVAKHLDLPINDSTARTIARFSSEFVDNKLRHSRFTLEDVKSDESVSPLLRGVYECLVEAANDKLGVNSSELMSKWAAFQKELEQIGSFSSYIDRLESRPGIPLHLLAQLYADSGNGFIEAASINRGISIRTSELRFKLNARNIKRMRFDPANTYAAIQIKKILLIRPDSSSYKVFHYGTNGFHANRQLLFDSEDPFLIWDVPDNMEVSECLVSIGYDSLGYEAAIYAYQTKFCSAKVRLERAHFELEEILRSVANRAILQRALQEFSFRSPMRALNYYRTARTIMASGLFDYAFYLGQDTSGTLPHIHPLVHFLDFGAMEGRNPHPLFDTSYYLAATPKAAESGMNPLVHFLKFGASNLCAPHPMFRTAYYMEQNPSVKSSGLNPLVHYLRYGASEGLNPHPHFDTGFYLANNPDVARQGLNPLVHFVKYGASEGRPCHPDVDKA